MKLSIQNWVVASLNELDQIKTLSDAGFKYTDWDLGPYLNRDEHKNASEQDTIDYYTKLKEQADNCGLNISMTHAIFTASMDDISKNDYMLCFEKCFLATSILGSKYMVVHPLIPKKWEGKSNHDLRITENIKFYNELTKFAEKYNVIICIENLYGSLSGYGKYNESTCDNSTDMLEIINGVNKREWFGFCYDSGHSQLTCKNNHPDLLKDIINDLKVVHLHGNDKKFDLHLRPSKNNLNWTEVLKIINDSNYDGTINFEILPIYTMGKNKVKKLKKLRLYLENFLHDYGIN